MSADDVAHMACRRTHPQLGDAVLCDRRRWHAGDHRGLDEAHDRLVSWPDASVYVTPGAFPDHDGPLSDPIPGDLDDLDPARVGGGPWPVLEVIVWTCLAIGAPPAAILVWLELASRF